MVCKHERDDNISGEFGSQPFVIIRAVRKSRIHGRRDYRDFRRVP